MRSGGIDRQRAQKVERWWIHEVMMVSRGVPDTKRHWAMVPRALRPLKLGCLRRFSRLSSSLDKLLPSSSSSCVISHLYCETQRPAWVLLQPPVLACVGTARQRLGLTDGLLRLNEHLSSLLPKLLLRLTPASFDHLYHAMLLSSC